MVFPLMDTKQPIHIYWGGEAFFKCSIICSVHICKFVKPTQNHWRVGFVCKWLTHAWAYLTLYQNCVSCLCLSLFHLQFQVLARAHPGRQWMMIQVVSFLLPTWKTSTEVLAPNFRLAQPWLLQVLRE